jgi:uncharacterized protein (TIGR02145 family)
LINYLDPNTGIGNYSSIAGGKMKSPGTQYWASPNEGATNETGFSGLPGGGRESNGVFGYIGNRGTWWSSEEGGGASNTAWILDLLYQTSGASISYVNGSDGYSVRCIKD